MTDVTSDRARGVETVWTRIADAWPRLRIESFYAGLGAARVRDARRLTGLTRAEMVARGYAPAAIAVTDRPETR